MNNTQKDNTGMLLVSKKWIAILLVCAIAIAAGVLTGLKIHKQNAQITELQGQIKELETEPIIVNPVNPEIILQTTNEEIKSIGELATMEYLYTDASRFSKSRQIKGIEIPFTEKSFLLRWNGVIKAGINVEEITTQINESTSTLLITMPAAEILSHDVDESSVEVLDEKNNLFNSIKIEDKVAFDEQVAQEMEDRAIKNGLLKKAQENAEEIITHLLYANPDIQQNYHIEFEVK